MGGWTWGFVWRQVGEGRPSGARQGRSHCSPPCVLRRRACACSRMFETSASCRSRLARRFAHMSCEAPCCSSRQPCGAPEGPQDCPAPSSIFVTSHAARFSQQTLPYCRNRITGRGILRAALATGTALVALGVAVLVESSDVAQLTIQYDGTPRRSVDTSEEEWRYLPCPVVPGKVNSCTFDIELLADYEPPIVVTYEAWPSRWRALSIVSQHVHQAQWSIERCW